MKTFSYNSPFSHCVVVSLEVVNSSTRRIPERVHPSLSTIIPFFKVSVLQGLPVWERTWGIYGGMRRTRLRCISLPTKEDSVLGNILSIIVQISMLDTRKVWLHFSTQHVKVDFESLVPTLARK
jgi:hypothetical protein